MFYSLFTAKHQHLLNNRNRGTAMPKIVDIYNYIDSFAPFDSAMDFDNVGILVGDKNAEVKRVVISLDITNDVIDEAIERSAQLIISHHPVIFNPIKKLSADSVVYRLAQNGIGALCAHTNLDLSVYGTNTAMFDVLELQNQEPLGIDGGLIGTLQAPMSKNELARFIKVKLDCDGLRFSDYGENIKRVALVAGAGGEGIFLAKKKNVQAFITGEIKHHEILFARENGISVFDVGHSKSEELITFVLYKKLKERFSDIELFRSIKYTDGINYMI